MAAHLARVAESTASQSRRPQQLAADGGPSRPSCRVHGIVAAASSATRRRWRSISPELPSPLHPRAAVLSNSPPMAVHLARVAESTASQSRRPQQLAADGGPSRPSCRVHCIPEPPPSATRRRWRSISPELPSPLHPRAAALGNSGPMAVHLARVAESTASQSRRPRQLAADGSPSPPSCRVHGIVEPPPSATRRRWRSISPESPSPRHRSAAALSNSPPMAAHLARVAESTAS